LDLVKGRTIFAVSLERDLSALMQVIPSSELIDYTEMMGQDREMIVHWMTIKAEDLGVDTIIKGCFVTTEVVTGTAEQG